MANKLNETINLREKLNGLNTKKSEAYEAMDYITVDKIQEAIDATYEDLRKIEREEEKAESDRIMDQLSN